MKKLAIWAASFLALAATAGASLAPLPGPLLLNATPPCYQDSPDVAALAGGDLVAVWTGNVGDATGLVGRLLGPDGQPRSDAELHLDGGESPFAEEVAVAPGAGGGFIVAWWEIPYLDPAPAARIGLRAYDADGHPRGPSVHPATAGGLPVPGIGLAADGAGRPAVAWSDEFGTVWVSWFDADLTPRGGPVAVAEAPPGDDVRAVVVAAKASGEILVAWEESNTFITPPPWTSVVRARRFDPQGIPLGNPIALNETTAGSLYSVAPAVAALAGGGFVVVWATDSAPAPRIVAQLLDDSGVLAGGNFRVNSLDLDFALDPDVAADPLGGFVVAWEGKTYSTDPFSEFLDRAYALQFNADGTSLDSEVEIAVPTAAGRLESLPALAVRGDRVVAVWREHYPEPVILAPQCAEYSEIYARAFDLLCSPSATQLCLQGGRFAVEVRLPGEGEGSPADPRATAVPLTDDSGTFWFFRPANVELMVKVLDGRQVNGHFWVFAGALSDVHYAIDVTDTLTGETQTYDNPHGRLASLADTGAFGATLDPPLAPALPVPWAVTEDGGVVAALPAAAAAAASSCEPDVLCLHDGRFRVRVEWRNPRNGAAGSGQAENLGDESGYFWFFRPGNAELLLKVLDGRTVNGFFWVFHGGLTDVEYTLTVEDTESATTWSYHNPPYALTSGADTTALPGPP
jgi:hypothetical protein